MSLLQLAKNSILHFKALKDAKKVGFGKIIVYLLLLSLISAIPITIQALQIFSDIQSDAQKIAQKIPDFTIKNGKMQTENKKGFIYQTNSIVFTFDPAGKRTAKEVSEDRVGNILSVGLLDDELVLSVPGNGMVSSLTGTDPIELSYKDEQLAGLSGNNLRSELDQNQLPWWSFLLVLFVSLYPSFLNLTLIFLIITIIGLFYSRMRRSPNHFLDNLKIMIGSATLPIIIGTIITLFTSRFDSTTFIAILTFFIFTQSFRASKD